MNTKATVRGESLTRDEAALRRSRAQRHRENEARPSTLEQLFPRHAEWFIRSGVASLFLVNAIVAIVRPEEFLTLVEKNILTGPLPGWLHLVMVRAAAVVDLLIAVLLLGGKFDRFAGWVVATWMATIAFMKVMNFAYVAYPQSPLTETWITYGCTLIAIGALLIGFAFFLHFNHDASS